MWKAVKWQGKYFNVYLGKGMEKDEIKIMYPPKDKEFIQRHRELMKTKGYEVINITKSTYTYRKTQGRC